MRDEGTEEWRKLPNEELRELYPSPSIIRIIKSKRLKWTGGGGACSTNWGEEELV
jgi:hypothetical protein